MIFDVGDHYVIYLEIRFWRFVFGDCFGDFFGEFFGDFFGDCGPILPLCWDFYMDSTSSVVCQAGLRITHATRTSTGIIVLGLVL